MTDTWQVVRIDDTGEHLTRWGNDESAARGAYTRYASRLVKGASVRLEHVRIVNERRKP